MAVLFDFIAQKLNKLDSIPKGFLSDVDKSQYEILDSILRRLNRLKLTASGTIEMSSENMIIIDEITSSLNGIFNDSEYISSVIDFASSFDVSKRISDKYFRSAFPEYTQGEFSNAVFDTYKRRAIEELSSSTITTKFLEPLKTQMNSIVSNGMDFKDSVKMLREYAIGNEKVDGKLLQYSRQIAYDSIAKTDRAYTSAIAEELQADWFYYTGGLIQGSREFCTERNDKYFHYLEVEDWSGLQWDGKIPNTTRQNIYENLGGYNCNHVLIPVSISQVPKSVVKRNVIKGNYTEPI